MSRTALVAGATGLIGQQLLRRLLDSGAYARIKVLTRRPLHIEDSRIETLQTDFSDLVSLDLKADDVYCCLGTTLREAGSREAFERVDFHLVNNLAVAARAQGAQQFLVISAIGSSTASPSFYSRVKGRMEAAVSALGYRTVHILQPSLLLGARNNRIRRPAEDLAQKLSSVVMPLFVGPLKKYRPVRAEEVADAMLKLAFDGERGVHRHELPLKQG